MPVPGDGYAGDDTGVLGCGGMSVAAVEDELPRKETGDAQAPVARSSSLVVEGHAAVGPGTKRVAPRLQLQGAVPELQRDMLSAVVRKETRFPRQRRFVMLLLLTTSRGQTQACSGELRSVPLVTLSPGRTLGELRPVLLALPVVSPRSLVVVIVVHRTLRGRAAIWRLLLMSYPTPGVQPKMHKALAWSQNPVAGRPRPARCQ